MRKRLSLVCACALAAGAAMAESPFNSPVAPLITNLTATGAVRAVQFDLYPAAHSYSILSAPSPAGPWAANTNFFWSTITNVSGGTTNLVHDFRATNATAEADFYRLQVTPLSSNALLAAQVLNRIAYGPTPDELERVIAIGADAYIAEQLAMDGLPETLDTYVSVATNSVASDPLTNWVQVVATGKMNQTNVFVFLTQPARSCWMMCVWWKARISAGPTCWPMAILNPLSRRLGQFLRVTTDPSSPTAPGAMAVRHCD